MLPIKRVHQVGGQQGGGRDIAAPVQLTHPKEYPALPSGGAAHELLSTAVQVLRHASVTDGSRSTYNVGFRQFCLFLAVANYTLEGQDLPGLMSLACTFAAYSFFFRGLQPGTIRSYLQGVDHHLKMSNIIAHTLWHPALNQTLQGIDRESSFETALINKSKLPFSLPLILLARSHVLANASTFELHAVFSALCLGFMFLLRKSEFLTDKHGKGRVERGVHYTLLSDVVLLYWGDFCYPSTSRFLPNTPPDYISIFLPRSKGDPMGKGATRFFPRQKGAGFCLVTTIYIYVLHAGLRPGDYFFAGPKFVVSSSILSYTMKAASEAAGLSPDRATLHSLRVGGLVSLFAAGVPAHLMTLAGRWASEASFIQYMRASMEQYETIAHALNRVDLVTAQHIKRLYTAPNC